MMTPQDTPKTTAVVWMHADGKITAVGGFVERELADAYATYCNERQPSKWFEVRDEILPPTPTVPEDLRAYDAAERAFIDNEEREAER